MADDEINGSSSRDAGTRVLEGGTPISSLRPPSGRLPIPARGGHAMRDFDELPDDGLLDNDTAAKTPLDELEEAVIPLLVRNLNASWGSKQRAGSTPQGVRVYPFDYFGGRCVRRAALSV